MKRDFGLCRVLVVDDDPTLTKLITCALEGHGASVVAVAEAVDALDLAEFEHFDVVVADIRLSGMDGHELLRRLMRLNPGLRVIMVTGYASVESAVRAMGDGAVDYITKPFQLDDLIERIRCAADEGASAGRPHVGSREAVAVEAHRRAGGERSSPAASPVADEQLNLAAGEEDRVRRALDRSGWNKSRAARLLGINRKRLYRLIRKYRVSQN
jgi:DNA-binding NtrC family response regulator